MSDRRLPVRPDLEQLKHQAKDLLHEMRAHDPDAQLADAQHTLARSYQAQTWTRLVQACQLIDAIWEDDIDVVRDLVTRNPNLLNEHAGIRDSNWGPPMSYAANLGRDRIIRLLFDHGARDLEFAAGRAALQGKTDTLRMIYELAGGPAIQQGSLAGPAYTLSVEGTAALFALGARVVGPSGIDQNTMEHLLGTDSRSSAAKHRILELYVEHGFEPPDTPIMAFHRGRIDLLERCLERDPGLLTRTFDIAEIYPFAPACAKQQYVAQGTPVHGTTLLHIATYFDDLEIATWLLDRGMNPDAASAIDADGFGGYTALFSAVVSQRGFWVNYGQKQPDEARFARLLLERGANPNAVASICAGLEAGHGGGPQHEYRNVKPLSWGERYPEKIFVSREALRLIAAAGGTQ